MEEGLLFLKRKTKTSTDHKRWLDFLFVVKTLKNVGDFDRFLESYHLFYLKFM